jgi:hypothetical protein
MLSICSIVTDNLRDPNVHFLQRRTSVGIGQSC